MAKKRTPVVFDQGTPERRQHNRIAVEQGADHRARLRILDQLEIDRLLLERLITLDQHSAGEHLFRLVTTCGYMPACKWSMDSNVRGAVQSISQHRANALVQMGLATSWLHAKAGRKTTDLLMSVVLNEIRVTDRQLPSVRNGLTEYQSFEGWWYGKNPQDPMPDLLADLPESVQKNDPFHVRQSRRPTRLNGRRAG